MAGRPRKYAEIDKARAKAELVKTACALFRYPYNDMAEEQPKRPSIREISRRMGLSEVKVKKLLIDGGYYSTGETRAIAALRSRGMTVEEISRELDMPLSKVKNLMSYEDTRLYGIGTNSAKRSREYRNRQSRKCEGSTANG